MRYAALLMLSGCVYAPQGARPLTAHEHSVVYAVAGESCDAETLDATRVLLPETRAAMYEATGYCEPGCSTTSEPGECRWGCAHGAFRRYRSGLWPFALAESWPLLVMWHASASDHLLAHEAAHVAAECRGEDPYTH